ncbi:integrator complex subunit 10-like [Tubulanus polymorphus]|uniref:integrator complex subunit 10-like n=1 Tax=Tubulanus polymorphus TaxID=672921 RepID=UPI003DA4952C
MAASTADKQQSGPVGAGNNEEWMVNRARHSLRTDPCAAKSWLLTARTMFPGNFQIQFEAYTIEKNEKNLREAAKLLQEMFANFANEPQLWTEIKAITDALAAEVLDSKTQFMIDLVSLIPPEVQCHMLFKMADETHDIIEQCRLKLLALARFPHLLSLHGTELVDTLISTEKHSHQQTPLNSYRKYLVCDVLPLLLKSANLNLGHKTLYRWLQKSIDFYVCYATRPAPPSELNDNTSDVFAGRRGSVIQGLTEKESYISNPWNSLYETMHLIGLHMGWQNTNLLVKNSVESRWQLAFQLYRDMKQKTGAASVTAKQVLFSCMVLLFECLYQYCSMSYPDQFANNAAPGSPSLVLIEAMKANIDERTIEPRPKKLRTESQSVPRVHVSKSIVKGDEVVLYLQTALKCWDLLHTEELEKDFNSLLHHWRSDGWTWFKSFDVDRLIYQGKFLEAVVRIQALPATQKTSTQICRSIQLACCHCCLGNRGHACDVLLNLVSSLPTRESAPIQTQFAQGVGRHLWLLPCIDVEILPYCIEMLVSSLKEKAFSNKEYNDMCLGHMLVLLQYDWPKQQTLFDQAMTRIRSRGSFTYNIFFNYIINIDILEEFAYVKTKEGGKVTLDILPISTKSIAQQRTMTRGVNKGVQEDFHASLMKQVTRSDENVESLIRQFLSEEREILKQNLTS